MTNHSTYVFECPCGKWDQPIRLQGPVGSACCIKCQRPWSVQWDIEIQKEREKARAAGK